MSAKRQRSKPRSKRAGDAIPAEILAEGSGPNEVVDATPQTLVEAAEDLVDKRKSRKRKAKPAKAADADTSESAESELAADDTSLEAASDDELDIAVDEPGDAEALEAVEAVESVETTDDENPDDALAFDAAAGNAPPDTSMSVEGDSVAAVEEAIMRAEAEAELGDAEDVEAGEEVELGAALPTTAASMDAAQLKNLVEALVFAADKPVTLQRLRQLTRVGDVTRLEQALTELAADYTNRGLVLQQVSGGYQFRTNTQYSVWVQQLIAGRPVRLSRAQLETLAIVAYRQPITRPEIDDIRGVDSSATLRLLLDRALIRTLGKKEDVGRPMLYGTTKEFLDFFSLGDLRELPTLREYSELTAESRKVMTDRLGVDPAGEPANDETVDGLDAKPAVEVDAWGQVINIPDEEPSVTGEDVSAPIDELSTSEADVSADGAELDESDVEDDELSVEDMSDESVEMSASAEPSTDADDDATPTVQVDAWGQVISVSDDESEASVFGDVAAEADELSASEDATSTDDEQSASGEDVSAETRELSESEDETSASDAQPVSGEDVSAETGELSASASETSADDQPSLSATETSAVDAESLSVADSVSLDGVSAETDELMAALDASAETDEADLGVPAGGSMDDRIDLAGVHASRGVDDELSDDESGMESKGTDDESLLAVADEIVAGEDGDSADDAPGDEPTRD